MENTSTFRFFSGSSAISQIAPQEDLGQKIKSKLSGEWNQFKHLRSIKITDTVNAHKCFVHDEWLTMFFSVQLIVRYR